ncbi:MAG TPA: condensation domain-containing protein [Methylocella sp.]|nr:condensation domain-containing protein [Methylocella sp.]
MPAPNDSGPRLSRAQKEIWMAQQIHPASAKYNIAQFIEITGPVDEQRFDAALKQAVKEADALNFCFVALHGEPKRVLAGANSWLLPAHDLHAERDPRMAAQTWMKADLLRPVDLNTWPLFAFALFKTAADNFLWYQRFHHIVMDGFSRAIFAQRVAKIYTELMTRAHRDENKFLSFESYLRDDDAYFKSEQFSDDRKYWLERFADRPEPTSLANGFAPASDRFLRQTIVLSQSELDGLNAVAQSVEASWKQVIVAAVAIYASRITRSADIVLTLPVSGRTGAAARRVPGMMSNALALRLSVHSHKTLSEHVRQVAAEIQQLLRHQRYRGEDLDRENWQRRWEPEADGALGQHYGLRLRSVLRWFVGNGLQPV